jgi:hypothetical protein
MKMNKRPTQNDILSQEEPAYVDGVRRRIAKVEVEPPKSLEDAIADEMDEHGNYHEWLVKEIGYGPLDQMREGQEMSYEAAKKAPDGVLVMEGDYGGQIYLSCPMKLVQCGPKEIESVLRDLDTMAWGCNEGDGADTYYLRRQSGQGIWGGMGGGIVLDGLWVHEEFTHLKDAIWRVLQGKAKDLKKALS